jgi:hypothetical protein
MLQALIDESQRSVTGTVRLKLYKGNTIVTGRQSPHSLYSMKHVTFEDDQGAYDQFDAQGVPYAAEHRRSVADGPVLVDGPHFRLDRVEGVPDAATIAAYPGALLVLPLAGEVAAQDSSARAGAGECLVADGLASLDFSAAGVTLLTRAA